MYNYKWGKYNSQVFLDAKKLRKIVFIEEQGFKNEFDEEDKTADHLVIYDGDTALATARMVYSDNECAKVGRICVLKKNRNKGLGSLLLKEAESYGRLKNNKTIHLGAQVQALEFYEKIGYKSYGEKFLDETTPHINMKKDL